MCYYLLEWMHSPSGVSKVVFDDERVEVAVDKSTSGARMTAAEGL